MVTDTLGAKSGASGETKPGTTLHRIITYGHSTLRVRCAEVTDFGDDLKQFAEEMFATMIENEGVGLAAPQVGRPIRFLVVGIPLEDSDELLTLAVINPTVLSSDGSWEFEEGCLSIPDVRDTVTRAETIRIRYQNLDGIEQKLEIGGLAGRVLLHEIDHLNGILFVDHLSPVRRALHSGKLKRMVRENKEQL